MSTAHKPTWDTARGGTSTARESDLSRLSKHYSSRDMPSHTKLKYRQTGQDPQEELKARDFRQELEDRERHAARDKEKDKRGGAISQSESSQPSAAKKPKLDQITSGNLDADDPVDDDEDEDTDSDEDDTAALMAELNRIKHERAAEKEQQEMEKKEQEERIRTENILSGNPLLNQPSDFKVKRRWDDDVVFKNCAKGLDDRQKHSTFINDSLRSEFHKKFMDKYIK